MCLQPSSLWLKYTHVIYNARKLSVCDSVLTSSEKESFIAFVREPSAILEGSDAPRWGAMIASWS